MNGNINKICRTCLESESTLLSIFDGKSTSNNSFADMIMAITSINISDLDELPTKICLPCIAELNRAYSFRTKCENSEITLRRLYDKNNVVKSERNTEICVTSPYECIETILADFEIKKCKIEENEINDTPKVALDLDSVLSADDDRNSDEYKIYDVSLNSKKDHTNEKNNKINKKEETNKKDHSDGKYNKINKKETNKKDHTNEKNNKIDKKETYKCEHCSMEFVFKKNLLKHTKNNHGNHDVEQNKISKEKLLFENSEKNDKEIDIFDNKHNQKCFDSQFKCQNCDASFIREKSLRYHLKHNKCIQDQYGCVACNKVFITRENLIEHMKTHTTFICSQCLTSFSQQNELRKHINSEHKGMHKNRCPYCDKIFGLQCSLKDHLRVHNGEKPFLCSICGKSFSQNNNLKQHMMRHTQTKPFKCSYCDKSYVSKGELNSHIRTHTGDHPFKCNLCVRQFTTASSLLKHKRIHTGERPYACEYCPIRFTALSVLKNHRRTHTGEKPYKCNSCSRSFAQNSDCVRHMTSRCPNKKYFCSICGLNFKLTKSAKCHVKSVHSSDGSDADKLKSILLYLTEEEIKNRNNKS